MFENLPEKSGVYIFKKGKKILYIGKAKNLKKRVQQYFQNTNNIGIWKQDMINKTDNIDYFLTNNEEEALILEKNLIKKHQPPYNMLLKGDSSYVYIKISDDKFPSVKLTRYKKPDNAVYIGPKPWKRYLKESLHFLRQILLFRTCSNSKFNKKQLCSDYMLGLCKGYCYYRQGEEEYKKNLDVIKNFFEGKKENLLQIIEEKINQAVEKQNFEYANFLKNIYIKVNKYNQGQNISFSDSINGYFVYIKKQKIDNKEFFFMIYIYIINGQIIDIVKTKNDENNFIKEMLNEGIINTYKILEKTEECYFIFGENR